MSKQVILTGLSACGKDTVARELTKHGYTLVSPYTTRPMRKEESPGKPYHFINRGIYHQMLLTDQFIESNAYCTMFNGIEDWHYYGTSRTSIEHTSQDIVLTIGVQSALRTATCTPDAILIYLDVPDDIRTERAKSRGSFDPIEWNNRMEQDLFRRKNKIYTLSDMKYVVNNTQSLDIVVNQILSILNSKENL